MAIRRVYVDSCVLMVAFKAEEPDLSDAALALLDDPDTEHLYSRITELGVMPKPTFHRKDEEREFYRAFFESSVRVPCTEDIVDDALDIGIRNGLGAGDSLHVACAVAAGADELVTSEKKTKLPNAPDPGVSIRTLRKE
ncbi:MAG: type II toxin-antitoxin system VapC family toxin [Rhodanobacter sp.]